MRKTFLLLFAFLFVSPIFSRAQYYETGQDPASIRWRQINTTNFQIIYPEEFEKEAQRVAYVFEKVYDYAAENLKQTPKKISVILHTHTVESNGLVAWAPKRVEFFTTPSQQTYSQDWLEQLATHEYTHVLQMNRVQAELPQILPFLFGEQAAAAVVGAYIPFWLLEGDAVTNETAFSSSGRGRLPSFLMENKALMLEKGQYSFNKLYLGSYKQYIPNYYHLGYWLTGKTKEQYGINLWNEAINNAARKPFSITPINRIIKEKTGLNQDQLYKKVFSDLEDEWKKELDSVKCIDYPVISPSSTSYSSYEMAHEYNGHIYSVKESLDKITQIVSIDEKRQERVVDTPGYILDESFSGTKNFLIWSEDKSDIRWTHADRSVICVYNLDTNTKKKIHTENKVFAPVISPNLKYFAAVEIDKENHHFLSVFDLQTGVRQFQYSTPDNQLFFTPCWNENSNQLYFVALDNEGKYIASWKLGQKTHEPITKSSATEIKNPDYKNGILYYIGSYSEIDNLYAIDLDTKSKYQLSSVKFGADYPAITENGQGIIFSNYTSDGFCLSRIKNELNEKQKIDELKNAKFDLADNLSNQLASDLNLQKPDSVEYSSKKYSKLGHIVNIHSWAPLYIDTDDYDARPGISMFSQDKLGTSVLNFGYDYNTSEKTGKFVAGYTYKGWFPVFELNVNAGKDKSYNSQDTVVKKYSWNELTCNFDMKLPLILSSGKYSRLLQPEVYWDCTNISHDSSTPDQFFSGNYQALSYRLYFHNMLHQSDRDLQSQWGQIINLVYRHSPFGKIDFGDLFAAESYLYFPGLLKNHGFRIYNGYQEKNISTEYSFSNTVRIPRGYYSVQNTQFYSFSADYRFPIAYPDLSIGKLAYIKRIRASLFYDYGDYMAPIFSTDGYYVSSTERNMSSVGLELESDFHVLRFIAPIEMGVRSVYRPDYQDWQFEFLFSIDFSSL